MGRLGRAMRCVAMWGAVAALATGAIRGAIWLRAAAAIGSGAAPYEQPPNRVAIPGEYRGPTFERAVEALERKFRDDPAWKGTGPP